LLVLAAQEGSQQVACLLKVNGDADHFHGGDGTVIAVSLGVVDVLQSAT
jgi:hypothetical protein